MGDGGPNDPGETNPLDTLFGILSAAERRQTIRLLAAHGEPMAISDVVDEIAAGGEPPPADGFHTTAQRIRRVLHHVHLPKLADADVIDHDAVRNTISPGAEFTRYATLLRLLDER